jgi:tight adherence protein B
MLLFAVVAALLVVAPSAAAKENLRLTEAGNARFPDRAFVLTLPTGRRLGTAQVVVRENGNRVSTLSVVPASAADEDGFGVVLVIDATLTMRGQAIKDAVAAARAFSERRNPKQQLAAITFNNKATVLLPFTTSEAAISKALASTPPLACCTPLYDAVDTALSLLERAKIAAGSVIVLSDGANTGSLASPEQVSARARRAHARIFSVAIKSHAFRPGPLRTLAAGSGGQYSETASTAQLAAIYDQLGSRLANEYLVRYRSLAGPDEKVRVEITVEGVSGVGASGYVTPALPQVAAEPFHRSVLDAFWQSPAAMILVVLLSAALFAAGLVALLRPRRGSLRKRMAHFVSLHLPEERRKQAGALTGRLLMTAEKSLESTQWWARFKQRLEIAEIRIPPIQIVFWTAFGTLVAMWLLARISGSPLFAVLGLGVPLAVRAAINKRLDRRRYQFAEQLPDNLQVLASALRAGHSFVGALSVVANEAQEPSRSEFQRVVADEQLGVPLDDALNVVVERMENRDLEQVSLVAALQRERGANVAEVLERVTDTIRSRFELRRMVKALTAQGRMARWIVSALPVALLLAISALNPEYIAPLFSNTGGQVLLVGAAIMVVAGSYVIKRIVEIKV